jgi:hypothetical protein
MSKERNKYTGCLSKPKDVSFSFSCFFLKNLSEVWKGLEVPEGLFSHLPYLNLDLRHVFMPRSICLAVQVYEKESIIQDYFKNSLALRLSG